MANAVRHSEAERDLEVDVGFDGEDLHVCVRDHGKGLNVDDVDVECVPDLLTAGGRGLFLINRLADDFALSSNGGLEVRVIKRRVLPPDHRASSDHRPAAGALHVFRTYRGQRQRTFLEEMSEASGISVPRAHVRGLSVER